MAIQQFDLGRSVAGGAATAGAINQVQRQNALADLFEKQGADIMSGDVNALRALAAVDPFQAMQVQQWISGERRAQQAAGYATNRENRAAETHRLSLQDRQTEIAEAAAANAAKQTAEENQRDLIAATNLSGWMQSDPNPETYNRVVTFLAEEDPAAAQALGPYSEESWQAVNDLLEGTRKGLLMATGTADPRLEASKADDLRARMIADGIRLNGWDEATSTAVVDGLIKIVPDQLGGYNVVDMRNPQIMGGQAAGGEPAPDAAPELSFSSIPQGNFDGAFGVGGKGAQWLNWGADVLDSIPGVDVDQPAPDIQKAQTALTNTALRTVSLLQKVFPGRASVQLMNRLEEIAARPAEIGKGPGAARDTLEQTATMLEGFIRQEEAKVNRPRGYTAQQKAEAQANLDQLRPLLADYRAILGQMDGGATDGGALPQSFISEIGDLPDGLTPQDVWNELDAETRRAFQQ